MIHSSRCSAGASSNARFGRTLPFPAMPEGWCRAQTWFYANLKVSGKSLASLPPKASDSVDYEVGLLELVGRGGLVLNTALMTM
jgi:hypothetical protein